MDSPSYHNIEQLAAVASGVLRGLLVYSALVAAGAGLLIAAIIFIFAFKDYRAGRRLGFGKPAEAAEIEARTVFLKKLGEAADTKALRFRPGTFGLNSTGEFVDRRAAHCYRAYRSRTEAQRARGDEEFFTTVWMTYWTQSPLLGYVLGGSAAGALVGAWLLPTRSSSGHGSTDSNTDTTGAWGSAGDQCSSDAGSSWFGGGDQSASGSSWSSGWSSGGSSSYDSGSCTDSSSSND